MRLDFCDSILQKAKEEQLSCSVHLCMNLGAINTSSFLTKKLIVMLKISVG
jgi:hypothetical protein